MKRYDKRRQECVSVPLVRHCELLEAEQRVKVLAVELAVAQEANQQLRSVNEMLGASVVHLMDQKQEGLDNYGVPPADVAALAPLSAERTDLAIYFRLPPKKAMEN
jgi:hypothetical protein